MVSQYILKRASADSDEIDDKLDAVAKGVLLNAASRRIGDRASRASIGLIGRVLGERDTNIREAAAGNKLREIIESRSHKRPGATPLRFQPDSRRVPGEAYYHPSKRMFGGREIRYGSILAHELGHATGGFFRSGGVTPRGTNIVSDLWDHAKPINIGLGTMANIAAQGARNEQQIDRAERLNRMATGAELLMRAPTLVEEARASIRGNALHKKYLGVGANKKVLLSAFGSYAGAALPTALTYGANKLQLAQRRKELQQRNARGG